MLLLMEDNCPVETAVRPQDRLMARVHGFRLDHDLAAGASPDASVALALRAQSLVRMSARRDLALTAQRIVAAAHTSAPGLPVRICRDRVRDCADELGYLARRLLADGPVSAQGVAQARTLLTDATSPIYHRASPDDLRVRVLAAADALSQA